MQDGGRMENDIVCDIFFKNHPKPKHFLFCKAINVYNNRYRINIYSKEYDLLDNIDKTKISESYFAILEENNTLSIVQ